MESSLGYIYIRNNKICEFYDAYKFGKVGNGENPINRFRTYMTYEIEPGNVILLIETSFNTDQLENELKKYFISEGQHIYYPGGGTEYFNRNILNLIFPFLDINNVQYHVCSDDEIERMNAKIYEKNIISHDSTSSSLISPKQHQIETLRDINEFYANNTIGKLVWSCGLGKSLMSLFIVKKLNFKTIVIGVPSKSLQKQFKKEILKLFYDEENILYIGSLGDGKIRSTTQLEEIQQFLERSSEECKFLITTYHSCYLLLPFRFDFKIGDEAHHLSGKENNSDRAFQLFHQIQSEKTLFMTATEKIIDIENSSNIFSMDNVRTFGKIIDMKSVKWAIENKKITDFMLIIIKNKEDEFADIVRSLNITNLNIELFVSAFMTLKAIEKYNNLSHILIYTNSTSNAELVKNYIDILLQSNYTILSEDDFYNNALHSKNSDDLYDCDENIGEITKFRNKKYGIISCVYLFGEGFNEPKLNGVTFADKMESDIRITQYSLRPNRLQKGNENKVAYNIIPYIENSVNNSFDKCVKIISKLRNIDSSIQSKITLLSIGSSREPRDPSGPNRIFPIDIYEDNEELKKLTLRLKYAKVLDSSVSEEQDEFNYIQQLNKELNIQSKEDYVKFKDVLGENYIDKPEEYFKSKGVWKNWLDFLGIDTSLFISNKQEWFSLCKQLNISSLEDYKNAASINERLPMNPGDFYINFTSISRELNIIKKIR